MWLLRSRSAWKALNLWIASLRVISVSLICRLKPILVSRVPFTSIWRSLFILSWLSSALSFTCKLLMSCSRMLDFWTRELRSLFTRSSSYRTKFKRFWSEELSWWSCLRYSLEADRTGLTLLRGYWTPVKSPYDASRISTSRVGLLEPALVFLRGLFGLFCRV